MSFLLEFFIDLWVTSWRADERLHGPSRRRWPWIVAGVALALWFAMVALEDLGQLPW